VIIKVPTAKAIASADFGAGTEATKLTTTSGIGILVFGYLDAVQRFADAAEPKSPDETTRVFIALFEALTWLNSLEEGAKQKAIGAEPAEKLIGDTYVRGMSFVRGRAHHHWALVIYTDHPDTVEWFWQRIEVLPAAPNYANPAGQKAYADCLEQKPVLATLRHVELLVRPLLPPG
jgi:hypothetical protein